MKEMANKILLRCQHIRRIIRLQQPNHPHKAALVSVIKRRYSYAVFFTRCGMDKFKFAISITAYNAYMANPMRMVAFSTGKKDNIAGFGILDIDLLANVSKIFG